MSHDDADDSAAQTIAPVRPSQSDTKPSTAVRPRTSTPFSLAHTGTSAVQRSTKNSNTSTLIDAVGHREKSTQCKPGPSLLLSPGGVKLSIYYNEWHAADWTSNANGGSKPENRDAARSQSVIGHLRDSPYHPLWQRFALDYGKNGKILTQVLEAGAR